MKIHFSLPLPLSSKIGAMAETLGFAIFALTFWWGQGFALGGNPTLLGPFRPELELIFPFCGIGLFLVFFGKMLAGTADKLSPKEIIFVLGTLGFSAISSVFSLTPDISILFLILWTTGFLTMATGDTFLILGKRKRWTWSAGILLGVLTLFFFPSAQGSEALLALGALWGMISILRDSPFSGRWFLLFFWAWVIFEFGGTGLVFLTTLIFFCSRLWLPRHAKSSAQYEWWGGLFFLFFLLVWSIFKNGIFLSFGPFISSFFSSISRVLFGVGEGQFLVGLQQFADQILLPSEMQLPTSGWLLAFFEKGLGGLIFLLLLLCAPILFSKRKKIFPSVLFGLMLLFTPVLVATENGILFLAVLILTERFTTEKFSNQL